MFRSPRRQKTTEQKQLWNLYVFGKQSVRELAQAYHQDRRTIRKLLDAYVPPHKVHHPRPVHLVVDGTYFGERTEHTAWCVVVAREEISQEELWWSFSPTETTSVYRAMYTDLIARGYTILSVTGDGFSGIRQAFLGIPFQMCHVHMERLVIKGTTRNPLREASQVLLALVRTLKNTDSHTFRMYTNNYHFRYGAFLNERTVNPETGDSYWTHEPVRSAFQSLTRLAPFLFTYEHDGAVPKTTNSLEGRFRHVNEIVAVHCGLKRAHKERVLHTIFLAGTIAPSGEKLREIL